jgi:hypothetical protein
VSPPLASRCYPFDLASHRLSTRNEVEGANNARLNQLIGGSETYVAMEYAGLNSKGERISQEQMERLLDRLVVPKRIILKVPLLCPVHIRVLTVARRWGLK